jgi:hypothetical protein
MKSTNEILDVLTPELFAKWLGSKKPGEVVGLEKRAYCCPLANYVKETTGEKVQIGNFFDLSTIQVDGSTSEDLPDWAWAFAEAVDASEGSIYFGDDPYGDQYELYKPVASRCIAVLQNQLANVAK